MLLPVVTLGFLYLSVLAQTSSGAFDWGKALRRKVDCVVSPWSEYDCDNKACVRSRKIFRRPRNGGKACPALSEKRRDTKNPWIPRSDTVKRLHSFAKSVRSDSPGYTVQKSRDLMFILDMSGSISKAEFTEIKKKMGEMIALICGTIGKTRQHNRIAVITFSKSVRMNFDFKTHFDLESVKKAIMAIPQERRSTCTGDALHYAHTYMFDPSKGVRDMATSVKEVLVLTDGKSNCGKKLTTEVKQLKIKAYVYALAIGVRSDAGRKEIQSMVSTPFLNHIFSVENYETFCWVVDKLKKYPYLPECIPFVLRK